MEATKEAGKGKGELETIVMCIKSGEGDLCPGKSCPVYENCWPYADKQKGYAKKEQNPV